MVDKFLINIAKPAVVVYTAAVYTAVYYNSINVVLIIILWSEVVFDE